MSNLSRHNTGAMTIFNALSKPTPLMIERINENVFRVRRTDLTHNPAHLFEQIQETVKTHHTCQIVTSRDRAKINGSAKLIDGIENDYRTWAFIIVHCNRVQTIEYAGHQFEVILNRYGNVEALVEPEHGIDLLTSYKVADAILGAYKKLYGTPAN